VHCVSFIRVSCLSPCLLDVCPFPLHVHLSEKPSSTDSGTPETERQLVSNLPVEDPARAAPISNAQRSSVLWAAVRRLRPSHCMLMLNTSSGNELHIQGVPVVRC
jgi:hypothetical protein